jgi:PhzF family phenazine biosynthesis protein
MKLPMYQVDAFASQVFRGNPAAIVPLERWIEPELMQSIAAENNLAETAFYVMGQDPFIKWYTPTVEMDLCGHATLASAFLLFEHFEKGRTSVTFGSKSGPLTVTRSGERLSLDFPSRPPVDATLPAGVANALGATPRELKKSRDVFAVFEHEDDIRALAPDFGRIRDLKVHGVIATAPGQEVDFVSRYFAPEVGVPEDPATGSSHCTLTPYWSQRLGRKQLRAQQLSQRGGEFWVEDRGDRVTISGRAVLYLEGTITV